MMIIPLGFILTYPVANGFKRQLINLLDKKCTETLSFVHAVDMDGFLQTMTLGMNADVIQVTHTRNLKISSS